jgi:DNA polymerase-3 subunit epsilon
VSAHWFAGDALAFDTETTGVDPMTDRIVTASIVVVSPEGVTRQRDWLINPGVEIPAGATAIHGVTTERARSEGRPPLEAVPEIATELLAAWTMGMPVIVMNAPFDLTLLNEELERVAHEPLLIGPVLDPLTIDRGCDPYRKGKRNLTALAQHYGVKQDGAHSSVGDALTAARIVWRQASKCTQLAQNTPKAMQDWQRGAHVAWAASLSKYRRQLGKPDEVDGRWPCR